MKRPMFRLLLWKSLIQRRGRSATTLAGLLLGASLVGALLSVSMDVGQKAGRQLEAYGANLILLPAGGLQLSQPGDASYLSEADLVSLQKQPGDTIHYAPYLYAVVETGGKNLVLGGTRLDQSSPLASWWKVEGGWPEPSAGPSALLGVAAARALGSGIGDVLALRYGTSSLQLRVSGILETGGSEDSQVLTDLPYVQELLGKKGAVGLVQVRAQAGSSLDTLARNLQSEVPGSEARVVGQVAQAEEQVLDKVELLMALVALLVLIASSLSVSSTLTTAVLERTREIGLMKALGAGDGSVAGLLLSEVLVLGLAGGLLGYGLGFVLAQIIGQSVFSSAVALQPAALGITVALALIVALICCVIPVRRVLAVDPAITLKGE